MLSQLLISLSIDKRVGEIDNFLSQNGLTHTNPDVLIFEDESKLGVEQAKQIREFLSIKPFQSKGKMVALVSAHNLTLDAQNSLLKTLEEPPENAQLFLGVEQQSQLLPTILSRCQLTFLDSRDSNPTQDLSDEEIQKIESLASLALEDRFKFIEKIEEREEFLELLIRYYRKQLKIHHNYLGFLKELMEAEKWQKTNVNIKAILEYLMFKIPNN